MKCSAYCHATTPQAIDSSAPCGVALRQNMPKTSGVKAATRVTL